MAAIVVATACAAAAGVVSKRHGATLHPAALNAPAMLIGGAVLAAAALATGEAIRLPREASTWAAIMYLAIVGSVVSFLVYFSLLKTWSVTSLSFISVFTPAIALALGFVFLDERPTLWTAVGAALILAGVALALTTNKKGRLTAAPTSTT
jgi:drug/metabolite transporter (DMT)-like permease